MQDPPAPSRRQPTLTPQAEAELRARREREAHALRENLRRRKEQARARDGAPHNKPDGTDEQTP